MGLFFEVLSAINNPNQPASVDQLGSIVNTVQQLGASRGIQPSTMQTVLSLVGSNVQSAMKEQTSSGGGFQLDNLLQMAGGGAGAMGMLGSLLGGQQQQQMASSIAQQTGLSSETIMSMLPTLLPMVMNLLKMGSGGPGGSNTILTAFLDANQDGSTDLGDALKFASRFINPAR